MGMMTEYYHFFFTTLVRPEDKQVLKDCLLLFNLRRLPVFCVSFHCILRSSVSATSGFTWKQKCTGIDCCVFTGPFRSWPGAVPLQWGQHDRVQAAQHRQLAGGIGGGEVGHGAAPGSLQSWDGDDGGDDDGEFVEMFGHSLFLNVYVNPILNSTAYSKSCQILYAGKAWQ